MEPTIRGPNDTAIHDYIHVDDLAAAHVLALEATKGGHHRVFNLGTGRGFSVRAVITALGCSPAFGSIRDPHRDAREIRPGWSPRAS